MGWDVTRMEGGKNFKISTGKPTEKRPLGRPRHRWKDKIKINIKGKLVVKMKRRMLLLRN